MERVSTTTAALGTSDDGLDEAATRLGVIPEVLLDARLLARRRYIEAGRRPPDGPRKRAGSNHYQIEMLLPPDVFHAWKSEAEVRGVQSSVLLRSLLHAYLLGSFDPPFVQRYWKLHEVVYRLPNIQNWAKEHATRYPYRERSLIPNGAKRALILRARRLGATPTAMARTLMILTMERKWAQPGTVEYVLASNMFDDENRYYLG